MKNKYFNVLLALGLSNLFLLLVSQCLGLQRPSFNIDYFLVLLCVYVSVPILRASLLFGALCIIYSIDVLILALQIFPFVQFTDLIYLSSFIFNGPILYRLVVIVVCVHFFILFFILRDIVFKNWVGLKRIMLPISALCVLIFGLQLCVQSYHQYSFSSYFSSQILFFIQNHQANFIEKQGQIQQLQATQYIPATQPLWTQLQNNEKVSDKILLVVNESWGATYNPEHQRAVLAPILNRHSQLSFLKYGNLDFLGATVAGELRELCQKSPPSLSLKDMPLDQFKSCLGNQLKQQNYKTYAFHAASSRLYERDRWYPASGFEHRYFDENFVHARVCKSFSGRCDIDLIPDVKKALLQHPKSFVYWLSLNTHAPYNDHIFIQGLDCSALKIHNSSETCLNFKLQYQFFSAIAQLIDDPAMQNVEIYVVGDHSPPIFEMGKNLLSFKGTKVAWVHFKIK